jgi:thermostable 8-oxoguanine DNA glycosylase
MAQSQRVDIPAPDTFVLPGVYWGRVDQLFTPAYWAIQAWLDPDPVEPTYYRLGSTLQEEIAACVLGGYGMPAELGLAAFQRLCHLGLLTQEPAEAMILEALRAPFVINGRSRYYRFPKQRARTLCQVLHAAFNEDIPSTDHDFRSWVLRFSGIGLKTASWITRNWFGSQQVAILDIHIYRAGVIAGIFHRTDSVVKHYLAMEQRFLAFAKAIGAAPSALDALMWRQMREARHLTHILFNCNSTA